MGWDITEDMIEKARERAKPKIKPPTAPVVGRVRQAVEGIEARTWADDGSIARRREGVPTLDDLRQAYTNTQAGRVPLATRTPRPTSRPQSTGAPSAPAPRIAADPAAEAWAQSGLMGAIRDYRPTVGDVTFRARGAFGRGPARATPAEPAMDIRTLSQLPPSAAENLGQPSASPTQNMLASWIAQASAAGMPVRDAIAEFFRNLGSLPLSPYQPAPNRYGTGEVRGVGETAENLNRPLPPAIRDPAVNIAERAGRELGEGLIEGTMGPLAPLAGLIPYGDVPRRVAGRTGEATGGAVVPYTYPELIAELFLPGVGTGPAIWSELAKGGPDAIRMSKRLMASAEGRGLLRFFTEEAGKLGDEGVELNPVTAGDIIGRQADELDAPPRPVEELQDAGALSTEELARRLDSYKFRVDAGGMSDRDRDEMDLLINVMQRRAANGDQLAGSGVVRGLIRRLRGEEGALGGGGSVPGRDLAVRAGTTAIGAGAGATQGETPQERLRNALLGAGVGLGVGDIAIRTGLSDTTVRRYASLFDETGAAGQRSLFDDVDPGTQPRMDTAPERPPELPALEDRPALELQSPLPKGQKAAPLLDFAAGPEAAPEDAGAVAQRVLEQQDAPPIRRDDYNDRGWLENRAAEIETDLATIDQAHKVQPGMFEGMAEGLRGERESIRQRLASMLRGGERGSLGTEPPALPPRMVLSMDQVHLRPEHFQARKTDPGLPWKQATVDRIARDFDPDQLDELVVVPDNEQGGYTIVGGHHRFGALKQIGYRDVPVRVIDNIDGQAFDITNPEHVRKAAIKADQTNAMQREVSLGERIFIIQRFGSDDVGEISTAFPAWRDQQILDAIYLREMPGHVVDKLDELKETAPEVPIAAEVGRAKKVYGFSEQDAEGLYNRLTRGKNLPKRGSVRETMERFGPALAPSPQTAIDFGLGADFSARNPILDMMDQHSRLVQELATARRKELTFIREAVKRGMSEADEPVRVANQQVRDLEARLARANDDIGEFIREQNQSTPDVPSQRDLPPEVLDGQRAMLEVESELDEMAAEVPPPTQPPRPTAMAGGFDEFEPENLPKIKPLGGMREVLPGQASMPGMIDAELEGLTPTAEKAQALAADLAHRPSLPPKAPRLSQEKLDQYLPARSDFEDQLTRAAENAGRYRLRLRAIMTRAQNEKLTQGAFGNLTQRAIKKAQADVRRAVKIREQARSMLSKSDVLVGEQDIIDRARAAGATDEMVELVQNQFRIDAARKELDTPLTGAPTWGQRVNSAAARVKGTVRVLNNEAQDRLSVSNALAEQTSIILRDVMAPLEKQLEKESASLRFVGKDEYRDLADSHRLYYIVTHPEDFEGISPKLQSLLDRADEIGKQQYEMLRALDSRVEPVIKGRYLPQLWEKTTADFERIFRPRGRPGVTKERTIRDWRKAILSDEWRQDLKDMTPGELLEYAARTVDQAIADATMRRSVLRRYGSPIAKKDLVPFRNPLYAGHHGPPEIVSEVDALYDPGPTWGQTEWTQKIKNQVFGPDFSVAGYNVLQALAGGNLKIAAAVLNRGLNKLGLGVDLTAGSALSKRALYSQYGLAGGIKQSPFDAGAGTLLSYAPNMKDADKRFSRLMQRWQTIQYGNILGGLNEMAFEGNVLMARLARQDVTSPKNLRALADNANAVTGTSRGAARIGRAAIEAQMLSSARITRSQFALLGQMAKIAKVGSPVEQLAAATTLAGFAATIGGLGYAISKMFGDGDYVFSPFSIKDGELAYNSEWATVPIKGRRYNLIPQKSLATTLAKSLAAVQQRDWRELEDALMQYGYTRISPGWQPLLNAAGYGFAPDRGFVSGGLPYKQRLIQSLPVPLGIGTALEEGGITPRAAAESALGLGSYPQPTEQEVAEKAQRERSGAARGVLEEYNNVDTDVWKELQEEGAAPPGHESIGEFRTATIAELVAAIRAESPDASIIDVQAAAERIYGRRYGELEAAHSRIVARIRTGMREDPAIAAALVESGQTDAAPRQQELATP